MRRIVAGILLSAITFLFFVQTPSVSYACSCMMPGAPKDELNRADAVFSGKVIEIKDSGQGEGGGISSSGTIDVLFNVNESWKGVTDSQVVVETMNNEASCGFSFTVGQDYLVYAGNDNGSLLVSLCSRTNLLSSAGEDLSALGSGSVPDNQVDISLESKGRGILFYSLIGVILIIVIGGIFFLRKSKN